MSLWGKAWHIWTAVGERLVLTRPLEGRVLQDVLSHELAEQMLASVVDTIPSQAILVSLLEVVLQVRLTTLYLCVCVGGEGGGGKGRLNLYVAACFEELVILHVLCYMTWIH